MQEWFQSANLTMMQQSTPAGKFGSYISVYQVIIILAGCIATSVTGSVVTYLDCSLDPLVLGRVIAGMCTLGYLGSIACWMLAKKHFNVP